MKFKKKEIEKETENAICLIIDYKKLWFQKKKLINFESEEFEITDNVIEDSKKNYDDFINQNNKEIKIISSVEDYNEKSIKVKLLIEIQDKDKKEFDKFHFFSKKIIKDFTNEYFIIPSWIWSKAEDEILAEVSNYSNATYSTKTTTRDFKILNIIEE